MLPEFDYVRPETIGEAISQLSAEGAYVHAGGTDLLGCMREQILPVKKVVSVSRLRELRGVGVKSDGTLRIGALTTISEVAANPLLNERYTVLAQGASEVASPQLRNQGTIGGNLCQKPRCWYYRGEFHCLRKGGDLCYAFAGENQFHAVFGSDDTCYYVHPSDTAPALTALDASVRISGKQGSRMVPLGDFFVPPGRDVTRETVLAQDEIVTDILIPPVLDGIRSSYRKVRARRSWDFALVGMALALNMEGGTVKNARVVLSGVAPFPWRSRETEQEIVGKTLNENTIHRAAQAAVTGAQPLGNNAYKIRLIGSVVQEQLQAMTQVPARA